MSRLTKVSDTNPQDFSKEQLLRAVITQIVKEVHSDNNIQTTTRDILNTVDGIMDDEVNLLKDLHHRIEQNVLAQEKENRENGNTQTIIDREE